MKTETTYRGPAKPREFCGHCGTEVSTRGRPPKATLGVRFCRKPECQAERVRRTRAAAPKPPVRMAPEACTACNEPMDPRPWRSGDELGRYHRRNACQQRRNEIRAKALDPNVAEVVVEFAAFKAMHEATMRLLNDAVLEERVRCPKCGLVDAVQGWGHYGDHQGTACRGTIDERSARFDPLALGIIWNGRRTYALEETT